MKRTLTSAALVSILVCLMSCIARDPAPQTVESQRVDDQELAPVGQQVDPISLSELRVRLDDGSRWLRLGEDVEAFFEVLGYPRDLRPGVTGKNRDYWEREFPQGDYTDLRLLYRRPYDDSDVLPVFGIAVSGPQYEVSRDSIRVGMDVGEVISELGEPDVASEQQGTLTYRVRGTNGVLVFHLEDGRVRRVTMSATREDLISVFSSGPSGPR